MPPLVSPLKWGEIRKRPARIRGAAFLLPERSNDLTYHSPISLIPFLVTIQQPVGWTSATRTG